MTSGFLFTKNCPNCGSVGKQWKKQRDVMECTSCNAVYSEFAFVSEGENMEEMVVS